MICRTAALFAAILISTSCIQPHNTKAVDLAIPPACVTTILMVSCDLDYDPPKCKTAKVKYKRGCETVMVQK